MKKSNQEPVIAVPDESEEDRVEAASEETRWAFMRFRTIPSKGAPYLKRIYVLVTPWFSVMLHRIFRPDGQRELHDHPWTFLSFVLRGWYREDTPEGERRIRWMNWKRAEDRHSIRFVSRKPVWTLVFTGPRRRIWGFWREGRFIPWREYDKLNDA